jgi:hypothetical protein
LEKLSNGKISLQTAQNILSLISKEALVIMFPSNSNQKANELEYGVVTGYVRENFDFTLMLRGNPVRMKAKSIPDLEKKVLAPLLEQTLNANAGAFNREVFQGRQIVSLAQKNGAEQGLTAYSLADGKIFLGSTVNAIKKILGGTQNAYPFYEPFIRGNDDGLLLADNSQGRLAELIRNDKNLAELGNILSTGQIQKFILLFNLVDGNSLTGTVDIIPQSEDRVGFLEKEVQLANVFMKGRLFLDGLSWSGSVQKQDNRVRMEFKIGNLKKYFEE